MFGQKIKFLRKENKVKVLEVAVLLGISKGQYLKKERGMHKVTADEIQKLVEFYGVDANYFFCLKGCKI